MKVKTGLIVLVAGFVCFCGIMIAQSGVFDDSAEQAGEKSILLQNTTEIKTPSKEPEPQKEEPIEETSLPRLGADHSNAQIFTIGAGDPCSENPETGFKFQLELSTKGAAVRRVTFSDGDADGDGKGDGFDNRDYKNPQPLQLLSPAQSPAGEVLSMSNNALVVDNQAQLNLDKLDWHVVEINNDQPEKHTAVFQATILNRDTNEPFLRVTKTYEVVQTSYDVKCFVNIENMSGEKHDAYFRMNGPVGIDQEGSRADMRMAIAGFFDPEKSTVQRKSHKIKNLLSDARDDRRLTNPGANFLWTSITNKYFAGIIVPLPEGNLPFQNWVQSNLATAYAQGAETQKETLGVQLTVKPYSYSGREQKTYSFDIYLGPKDKRLFDKNEFYDRLGFVNTITFLSCCCPAAIINPLAFGVLAIMDWIYSFIGNYGIAIIILVFLIRLAMHPVTKKSQISMSKMSKLGPQMEELKKKYGNNKAELQKQTMLLYKKQGASPVWGFLPMMMQMPIWIALYSAIYASISLRGAAFLPVWITDLSAPDALIPFQTISLPIFGDINSFNLLPFLMGIGMYLQQKTMPKTPSTSPQAAQQQKMMMIMMPLMFPLLLYKAPSGLNLYIMASTFAGAIEQRVIRKHIREKEERQSQGLVSATSKTGGKKKKKKPKPFYKTNR